MNHSVRARRYQKLQLISSTSVLQSSDLALMSLDEVHLIKLAIALGRPLELIDPYIPDHIPRGKLIPCIIEAQAFHPLVFLSKWTGFTNDAHTSIEDIHLIIEEHYSFEVAFHCLQGRRLKIQRGLPLPDAVVFAASKEGESVWFVGLEHQVVDRVAVLDKDSKHRLCLEVVKHNDAVFKNLNDYSKITDDPYQFRIVRL